MLTLIAAYILCGWAIVAAIDACDPEQSATPMDYLRTIPLWPVTLIVLVSLLLLVLIEWGIDD